MVSEWKPLIEEVFRYYYGEILVRKGRGWTKFCCPVHAESNPSATYNTEDNRWRCFVCNLSEDSFDVIQREEGIGFREAKAFAAEHFSGGSEAVLQPVQRKPSRTVYARPRFGRNR